MGKPSRAISFTVLGFGILLCAGTMTLAVIFAKKAREDFDALSPEAAIRAHLPQIKEDAKLLDTYVIFGTTFGTADAGRLLNDLLDEKDLDKSNRFYLDPGLRQKLREHQRTKKPFRSKLSLDFSWFGELAHFDHWNYDRYAPFAYTENDLISSAPTPSYARLRDWVRLYLADARARGTEASAAENVRQLARLVFTHDNLIAAMVVVGLLDWSEEGLPPGRSLSNWRQEGSRVAKRYFYATSAFTDLRLSPELFSELDALAAGRCLRINEGLFYALGFRTLIASAHEAAYRRLTDAMSRTAGQCRPSFVRNVWRNPDYRALLAEDTSFYGAKDNSNPPEGASQGLSGLFTVGNLENVPYLATAFGHFLGGIAQPNWLKYYDESASRQQGPAPSPPAAGH